MHYARFRFRFSGLCRRCNCRLFLLQQSHSAVRVCVGVCVGEGVPVCVAYTLCISNVCSVYCLIYQAWIIYVCRYVQTEQPVPLENQLGFSSQNRIYNPACCHVATINGECQHECDLLQHTHFHVSSLQFDSIQVDAIELNCRLRQVQSALISICSPWLIYTWK